MAVSYTHLDVYKRQVLVSSTNGVTTYTVNLANSNGTVTKISVNSAGDVVPVSYTHLDVYKRQPPTRAVRLLVLVE